MSLPVAPPVVDHDKPATSEVGVADGNVVRRVLIVDGSVPAANMLSMLVKTPGREVHTTHDGEQALKSAVTFRPDLVLMDLGMPKMDGYEAARRIRQESWAKTLTLVALTGWARKRTNSGRKTRGSIII